MSRIVICDAVYASLILNPGRTSETLSLHLTFPSSTNMPTQTAVIALVVDAQIERVDVSKADVLPSSVTPYPFLKITFLSFTTATARPGTFHSGIVSWAYLSKTLLSSELPGDFFSELVWDRETENVKRRIANWKKCLIAVGFVRGR